MSLGHAFPRINSHDTWTRVPNPLIPKKSVSTDTLSGSPTPMVRANSARTPLIPHVSMDTSIRDRLVCESALECAGTRTKQLKPHAEWHVPTIPSTRSLNARTQRINGNLSGYVPNRHVNLLTPLRDRSAHVSVTKCVPKERICVP